MTYHDWFEADIGANFEESVRIDREDNGRDHRLHSIDTYHVTDEAEMFLSDFFARLLERSEDMRSGTNYWLHGYYGSGKSHLLTVLEGLMDSQWCQRRDDIWTQLTGDQRLPALERTWRSIHDEYEVIPVSVNLLKYQGQKERSFSEIILRAAHSSERLTGVEGGFSSQLEVAYFEDWYRGRDAWDNRTRQVQTALTGIVDDPREYEWQDIQQYSALADVVLPELFERETGGRAGQADLMPSDLDPVETVEHLEQLRREQEGDLNKPVKLVLLLDEVSLFAGNDFGRLTELQTLAEKINQIGDGNIQFAVTAQSKAEDVQAKFAAREGDKGILKDRFPHRFGLLSKHVGEISTQRLLKKTDIGQQETKHAIQTAANSPETLLVYSGLNGNIDPPLDTVGRERLIDFYPLLPYQPGLFLSILSNLREEAPDPAKSIFSGTARAILALVHGLIQDWLDTGNPTQVISLVDFYDLIRPELEDITPQDVEIIDEIEGAQKTGDLNSIDADVAKAVLLLQHVPDLIPMSSRNLGVAVLQNIDDLTQFQMENRVEDSLDRLRKFIRETRTETGAKYTFTGPVEREIYQREEENRGTANWDAVIKTLDQHLWREILREVSLPQTVEYKDTGDQYPVRYEFSVDGISMQTTVEAEDALDITVSVTGVTPELLGTGPDGDPVEWQISDDGIEDLRDTLIEWWALNNAVGDELPDSVENDLADRASRVQSKLSEALSSGSYSVKDRVNIRGLSTAVEEAVDTRYPDDFHPVMSQVDGDQLDGLRRLSVQDPLPAWAQQIEVATEAPETHGGSIQNNVRSFTGQQLTESAGTLAMSTILDGIIHRKPIYAEARPAVAAIIWGLCRKGDLLPVDESGDSLKLDTVIDLDRTTTTRLKIVPGKSPEEILREAGFLKDTELLPDGIVRLQETNQRLAKQFQSLAENVELVAENDINDDIIVATVQQFSETLNNYEQSALARAEEVRVHDPDWQALVDETNTAQETYQEVTDVWNDRLTNLTQIDAQLTLIEQSYDWLSSECETAGENLRDQIVAFDGNWWTEDGWSQFPTETDSSSSIDDAIGTAWNEFQTTAEIDTLAQELQAHQWVKPIGSLGSSVRPAFESRYIRPLSRALSWYNTLSDAVNTVTGSAVGTSSDMFIQTTQSLNSTEQLREAAEADVDTLRTIFDELNSVVGDTEPEDVQAIGVMPSDRDTLMNEVERLVNRREFEIEQTDNGVILR